MNDIFERYPGLTVCKESMINAVKMMCETYYNGGKILVCGNGGSCADSEHIVGELMKSFTLARKIPAEDREKLPLFLAMNQNFLLKISKEVYRLFLCVRRVAL